MKKSLISLIIVLGLVLSLTVCAQAETYAQVYNTDALNIRSGPGTEYAWLGSVPRDGQVRVIGESGSWYQITTLDGAVTGYMSKNFLTIISSGNGYNYDNTSVPISSNISATIGYVVGTAALNVRSGPGTQYSMIGSLPMGERVYITAESGAWYLISSSDLSLKGYVSKSYISSTPSGTTPTTPPYPIGTTAYVNNPAGTRFLNLREYPSYDSNVLGIYYNGDVCTVLSRQSDGWVYVSITKGGVQRYGYFRGEYLSSVPVTPDSGSSIGSATVNTWLNGGNGRTLNLRQEPATYASIIARIPNGSKVTVYQRGHIWWQVAYGGLVGYVDSGFLNESGSNPQPSYNTNAYVRTGNGGKLNLREQANATARVLGQYENGTGVYVIQRGATWCYVQVNGQYGYMMTQYLSISGGSSTKTVMNPNGGTYVNLRTSPDKNNYNVYKQVPVGATVSILTWGQEWSLINYNGTTGYMMSWFLK